MVGIYHVGQNLDAAPRNVNTKDKFQKTLRKMICELHLC